jgi:NADPH-dependent ferric siderophore reductase
MTGPTGAALGAQAVRGGRGGGRRRPPPLRARVERTARLSPHLIRVTVAGPELAGFNYPGPASHFKILIPSIAGAPLTLPTPGEDGLVGYDPDAPVTMRTYTARAFRPESGELDVEFFVHGDGPAAQWAIAARPGDELGVSSPRRSGFALDPAARWLLLAGDSSAIPALGTILETDPAIEVTCLVELEDGQDAVPFAARRSEAIEWVIRPEGSAPGAALREAIAGRARRLGAGSFWVAGEAAAIRQIRADLLDTADYSREALVTRGYWRGGHSNHPDHDDGAEPID